jgi:hypothetical protein
MKPLLVVLGSVCLAACAAGPRPAPNVVTQVETLAVPEPCSASVAAPDFPDTAEAIRAAPNIHERAKLYAAGRQLRIAYEAELAAAIAGCRKAGVR